MSLRHTAFVLICVPVAASYHCLLLPLYACAQYMPVRGSLAGVVGDDIMPVPLRRRTKKQVEEDAQTAVPADLNLDQLPAPAPPPPPRVGVLA